MFLRLAALVFALSSTAVCAAETAWQEVAPGTRVRLVSNDVLAVGQKTLLGFEINLGAGQKTYWRIPGETGIPAILDWRASEGVTSVEMAWPFPLRETKDGYMDYVYYGDLILPVTAELNGSGGRFSAELTMGVCSDICVPVMAHFELPLAFEHPARADGLRLRQALALVPEPWTKGRDPVGDVHFDAATSIVSFSADETVLDLDSLIVDTGDPALLFDAPQKSPKNGLIEAKLLGNGGSAPASLVSVRLTFMTATGPYEVTKTLIPEVGTR